MKKRKKRNMIYQNYETKCDKFCSQKVTEGMMNGIEAKMNGLKNGMEANIDGI